MFCDKAEKLKWVQALGTGVDNLVDLPSLRPDVIITNIHGIHGAAMSEAAIMAMLALSRNFPRIVRNQARHEWQRWPASLLEGKTVGIFGVGAISRSPRPQMQSAGDDGGRNQFCQTGRRELRPNLPAERTADRRGDCDYLIVLTPYSSRDSQYCELGRFFPR